MPRALITGITGQDGQHLAEFLHSKGYEVFGLVKGQNNPKAELVSQELLPKNLQSATVLPSYFDTGYRYLELPGEVDDRWHAAWQEFKAGA